jgi:hypothetical protein
MAAARALTLRTDSTKLAMSLLADTHPSPVPQNTPTPTQLGAPELLDVPLGTSRSSGVCNCARFVLLFPLEPDSY